METFGGPMVWCTWYPTGAGGDHSRVQHVCYINFLDSVMPVEIFIDHGLLYVEPALPHDIFSSASA